MNNCHIPPCLLARQVDQFEELASLSRPISGPLVGLSGKSRSFAGWDSLATPNASA